MEPVSEMKTLHLRDSERSLRSLPSLLKACKYSKYLFSQGVIGLSCIIYSYAVCFRVGEKTGKDPSNLVLNCCTVVFSTKLVNPMVSL